MIAIVAPPVVENPDDLFAIGLTISVLNLGGAHLSKNSQQADDLAKMTKELFELVEQQKIAPIVSQTVSFDRTKEALQLIKERQVVGKIVVDFSLQS